MGASAIFPVIVGLLLIGTIALTKAYTTNTPAAREFFEAKFMNEAQDFIAYRNAVSIYATENPSFMGEIAFNDLRNAPKSSNGVLHNAIVSAGVGSASRLVVVYGNISSSAMHHVYAMSLGDASLGVAHTPNSWTSFKSDASAYPLPVAIPQGALVAVFVN